MKKAGRQVYRILFKEIDSSICALCKYSKCEGGISPCDTGEPYCVHPLRKHFEFRNDYSEEIYPGDDCWGFRPSHPIEFCADVVGIVLQKGWIDWVLWQNKKGEWKMWGQALS